jgi:hypothetical protein
MGRVHALPVRLILVLADIVDISPSIVKHLTTSAIVFILDFHRGCSSASSLLLLVTDLAYDHTLTPLGLVNLLRLTGRLAENFISFSLHRFFTCELFNWRALILGIKVLRMILVDIKIVVGELSRGCRRLYIENSGGSVSFE